MRALRSVPLLALGSLSFGIYLWHEPMLLLLHQHGLHAWFVLLLVGLPLAVGLATASYLLVERPFLRLRDVRATTARQRGPELRLAVVGVAVAALVGLAALVN